MTRDPSHHPTVGSERGTSVPETAVAEVGLEKPRSRGSRRPVAFAGGPMLPSTNTPLVFAVLDRAEDMGLMTANMHQVGARLPLELLEQAKRRTGIASTTELLAFALANVAIEDNFAEAFVAARGKLDPDLDIGF